MSQIVPVTVIDPLELVPGLKRMTESSTNNIVVIVVLSVVALILCVLSIFLAISNSRRFAAVDYESAEDEPSEDENMKQLDNHSDAMSSISEGDIEDGEPLMREGNSDGSPQVGSLGDPERTLSEGSRNRL